MISDPTNVPVHYLVKLEFQVLNTKAFVTNLVLWTMLPCVTVIAQCFDVFIGLDEGYAVSKNIVGGIPN